MACIVRNLFGFWEKGDMVIDVGARVVVSHVRVVVPHVRVVVPHVHITAVWLCVRELGADVPFVKGGVVAAFPTIFLPIQSVLETTCSPANAKTINIFPPEDRCTFATGFSISRRVFISLLACFLGLWSFLVDAGSSFLCTASEKFSHGLVWTLMAMRFDGWERVSHGKRSIGRGQRGSIGRGCAGKDAPT
jgi:hypothetical protein